MKILFVFYVPSGGVETLNRQRCQALRPYGVEGHCLYYRTGSGVQNFGRHPSFVTDDDAQIGMLLREHAYGAVVVVSDYWTLPRFRRLGYTGPLILEIQGLGSPAAAREELTRALPHITGHAAALLHPRTPHIAGLFDELYPHIPKFQFNNCLNTAEFSYQPGFRSAQPILGWLGRLEDNKNWREFLHIGHLLIHGHTPSLRLWMFEDAELSSPEERRAFQQLVGEYGLSDNLTLYSNIPHAQMPTYFSAIGDSGGLLCSTSKSEGAPYALLEAMSCRCPVVSSDADGVLQAILHNRTGKLYRLGDVLHAVNEIAELLNDAELRERIRTTALLHVQTSFSPDEYARQFIGMLAALHLTPPQRRD
ncbi:Glycosyltransferase involved in cell wall bisynthesis [Paenibacillus sp. UNCCL117]|uniref:glycosyltransferase family 4 protein n=1 Tax=unclassified Paenibacillus TaxID=185978 RepID=UPI0008922471|nr:MULTISPECIES: glycosyltransferase family 4 protein [unclassified Paenibacillus]SDD30771.1 Glycosyltransferase involved in cell wall bisynthesis [Paenibacillus sp. cl123]SFW40275.1 Glycosyltransferase involved in cell wall bisynthesis [Paenibacillus sp. UNCCL117]